MKLITEMTESVQFITEDKEGKKNYHIEGVFMQSGVKNRNGRIYPTQTLSKEVDRYSDVYVKNQRAMGELGHPDGPTVDNGINEVQEDFMLAAVDIVADPSAPNAFVNGIMEGKEWIWDNGIVKEVHIHEYQQEIKRTSRKNLEERAINLFSDFISKL